MDTDLSVAVAKHAHAERNVMLMHTWHWQRITTVFQLDYDIFWHKLSAKFTQKLKSLSSGRQKRKMERMSIRPSWINSCPQVIGIAFHVQSVHLKKEAHTDERKQGSIDLIACPINPYVFSDSLTEGADQSGRWAPLIGQSGQSVRLSGNGRSSRCPSSHLALSLYQRQYWHLCPHYLELSAMYRPFICCERTSMFLLFASLHTIHFSLSATDPSHLMTNTGATQHHLGNQRIWSGSRIRRDVYLNRITMCVCASGCLALTGRDVHLRLTWVSPPRTAPGSYLCRQYSPWSIWLLDWCEHVCVSAFVCFCAVSCEKRQRQEKTQTEESCLFIHLPIWGLEGNW